MALLTQEMVRTLAVVCAPFFHHPDVLVGIARGESGFREEAVNVNVNPNGTTTRDYGLMQVNERNFQAYGLTPETALDGCNSMRVGALILMAGLSEYNTGSRQAGIANGYVEKTLSNIDRVMSGNPGHPEPKQAYPTVLQDQIISFSR